MIKMESLLPFSAASLTSDCPLSSCFKGRRTKTSHSPRESTAVYNNDNDDDSTNNFLFSAELYCDEKAFKFNGLVCARALRWKEAATGALSLDAQAWKNTVLRVSRIEK